MRKAKIGIFTHPLHSNYGGILQAWALQCVLRKRGFDVETFAISCPRQSKFQEAFVYLKRIILKFLGKYSGPIFLEISNRRIYNRVNGNLKRFVSQNIRLKRLKSINDVPQDVYDTIIVGSDQVWRDIYTNWISQSNRREDAFLYSIDGSFNRIAYAASFGIDSWTFNKEETIHIQDALKRFKAISVRESSGEWLLSNYANCKSQWVLDPTMMLNEQDYIQLYESIVTNSVLGKGKVVTYILDPSDDKNIIINKVVESRNSERLELNIIDENRKKTSIEDWLCAISNAEIVITDSFHGCVFSIIFRKPLIFIMNEDRGNARFDSLIEKFGIDNNLLSTPNDLISEKDYFLPSDVEEKLVDYRQISNNFLDKALS